MDSLVVRDPYPFETWIAYRTSGGGSGTASDPWDGSSAAKFDLIMGSLPSNVPVTVHLGPTPVGSPFQTNGYYVGAGSTYGWRARANMKIIGSGVDTTVLQVTNVTQAAHYYAIAHDLNSATKLDYMEISDLTIDCGLPTGTSTAACGAIRIFGDHCKIRRVKAISWGTKGTVPCYVFSIIAALPDSGIIETVDSGIDECIAILPGSTSGPTTAFHIGSQEDINQTNEGFAKSPYIRNCFVDCGVTTPSPSGNFHGLSMGWCRGGVVEGNQVYNADAAGPYQDKRSARDIVVRNNFYKNTAIGIYWNLGYLGASSSGYLSRNGSVLTVVIGNIQGLAVGDRIKLVTAPSSFSGVYVIKTIDQQAGQFTATTPVTSDSTANISTAQKVLSLSRAIVEGNIVELIPGVSGVKGIWVDDNNATNPYAEAPDYVHGDIFIRNNKTRYVDGSPPTGTSDIAIQANGAKNLQISNNIIDTANATPLQNQRCGSVKYFNNLAPNGALIQGYNPDILNKYSEPATDAEDAFVLAFMNT